MEAAKLEGRVPLYSSEIDLKKKKRKDETVSKPTVFVKREGTPGSDV